MIELNLKYTFKHF